jgi:hypothetical protein
VCYEDGDEEEYNNVELEELLLYDSFLESKPPAKRRRMSESSSENEF